MIQKKDAPPNYDYTVKDRVKRQRKQLAEAGGARVEVHLDADELGRLNALIDSGKVPSRSAAIKYAVMRLKPPIKTE